MLFYTKIHRPIHIFIIGQLQWKVYVQNFMRVLALLGHKSLNVRVEHLIFV